MTFNPDPPTDPASPPQTPYRPAPPPPQPPPAATSSAFTPLVTYTLLAVTTVIFGLQLATQALLGFDLPAAFGLKVNQFIAQGQIWRLITPIFLHGSLVHLGFNMYALYLFGPGLERYFGRARFLTLYGLSGFAGNVASLMFSAANSLGSSTAIFGLLGAEGVFVYQNRALLGRNARRALSQIVTIAAINLIIGLNPMIDNWGHIGGLLGGGLFTWLGGPLLQVKEAFPVVTVRDQRASSDVVRAAMWVGVLFALLAALTIYFRLV